MRGTGLVIAATPSEPLAISRSDDRSRREARAELGFQHAAGRTMLARCRTTAPLRVPPPVDLDGCAYTTIVNIAGGVAAGDGFDQRIEVGRGAHALLTTQSATKIYRSPGATARSVTSVLVEPGAAVEWVPDAVIPFAGARFEQSLTVEVQTGGAAIVADSWAAGRLARQERWAAWLAGACRITVCGRSVYEDRFEIKPHAASGLEGWPYVATWIAAADRPIDWNRLVARLAETMAAREPMVYGGASTLTSRGVAARFVAADTPSLAEVSASLWSDIRESLLGLPRPCLRKY